MYQNPVCRTSFDQYHSILQVVWCILKILIDVYNYGINCKERPLEYSRVIHIYCHQGCFKYWTDVKKHFSKWPKRLRQLTNPNVFSVVRIQRENLSRCLINLSFSSCPARTTFLVLQRLYFTSLVFWPRVTRHERVTINLVWLKYDLWLTMPDINHWSSAVVCIQIIQGKLITDGRAVQSQQSIGFSIFCDEIGCLFNLVQYFLLWLKATKRFYTLIQWQSWLQGITLRYSLSSLIVVGVLFHIANEVDIKFLRLT